MISVVYVGVSKWFLMAGLLTVLFFGCGGLEDQPAFEQSATAMSVDDASVASEGRISPPVHPTNQRCSDPWADGTCYSQANCRSVCGGEPGFICVPATNCCYCE